MDGWGRGDEAHDGAVSEDGGDGSQDEADECGDDGFDACVSVGMVLVGWGGPELDADEESRVGDEVGEAVDAVCDHGL